MRWLTNALIVLVAAALPCVAIEGWLRATAPPPDTPDLFIRVPTQVEWAGRAHASGMHAGVPVAFNEHGMRDRARSLERQPDVMRILALGDSMTFGMGVPFEEAWPSRMEALLRERTETPVEVLNFGIPGFNTLHQLAQLREVGLAFKPDIVVVGFFANDVDLSERQRAAQGPMKPAGPAPGWKSALNGSLRFLKDNSLFFAWLTPRVGVALRPLGLSEVGHTGSYRHQFADDNPNWKRMRAALLEMRSLAEEHGFELALAIIPTMARFDERHYPLMDYHEAVASFARSHGIACLDLLPAFWGRDGSRMWISPTDGHPNGEAHAIMAEALAGFLHPKLSRPESH